MNQNLSCSIFKDLLPNYIEKLSSNDTNYVMEQHLRSCKECHKEFETMSAKVNVQETTPKRELKFRKIKKTKIIAALLSIVLSLTFSYLLYASEYEFTNDKGVLSSAITDYTSFGKYSLDAYVLETKEVDGVLVAFFKDNSNPDVYGFARLLKGFNQKYRLVGASFSPVSYSSVLKTYSFESKEGKYWVVGGHAIDDAVEYYSLNFYPNYDFNNDEKEPIKFKINNSQFLDFHLETDLIRDLKERIGENNYVIDQWRFSMLDATGKDITEAYRNPPSDDTWSSGTGTVELFMLYVFIAIVLFLGFIFTRYFLTD